jgi:FkbM family methyltransferase
VPAKRSRFGQIRELQTKIRTVMDLRKIFDYLSNYLDAQALLRLRRHHHHLMTELAQLVTSDQEGLTKVVQLLISNEHGRTELRSQLRGAVSEVQLFDILHPAAEAHKARLSFSQSGEDLIAAFILQVLSIERPTYLDLGAYDPFHLSNTAYFYLSGSSGINVEPNPEQYERFLDLRPKDVNLNVGVADRRGEKQYYLLDTPTLNTFSREEAERYEREAGHHIVGQIAIPIITLQDILDNYCEGVFPDFLSVDIEGFDELVVAYVGQHENAPKVICIETMSYSRGGQGHKNELLIQALRARGYLLYADTYINSIFVQENLWREFKG